MIRFGKAHSLHSNRLIPQTFKTNSPARTVVWNKYSSTLAISENSAISRHVFSRKKLDSYKLLSFSSLCQTSVQIENLKTKQSPEITSFHCSLIRGQVEVNTFKGIVQYFVIQNKD